MGALVGWNIPEEEVRRYEDDVKKGGILVGVRPRSHEDSEYFARHWNAGAP